MHRIKQVAFFMGGVILPLFSEALIANINSPDDDLLSALIEIDIQLALGNLSQEETVKKLSKIIALEQGIDQWLSKVMDSVAPNPAIESVLARLSPSQQLWLLADYPKHWVESIIRRTYLNEYFDVDRVIVLKDIGPYKRYEQVFSSMVQENILQPGHALVIDHHSLRTAAALKAGLDTAIFVDVPRLIRDLSNLWGILA